MNSTLEISAAEENGVADFEELVTTDPPIEDIVYYNTHNNIVKFNWLVGNKDDIPDSVLEVLESCKREAVVNRIAAFPKGPSPYFNFIGSPIAPSSDWFKPPLNEYILQNVLAPSLIKDRRATDDNPIIYKHKLDDIISNSFVLSKEQTDTIGTIYRMMNTRNFSMVSINGAAGSGKTFIIKQLQLHRTVIYLTVSKFLCHTVSNLYGCESMTICKFLMKCLKIKYFPCLRLQDMLHHIRYSDCKKFELASDLIDGYTIHKGRWATLREKLGLGQCAARMRGKTPAKRVIFLDEYSLLPEGTIGLIVEIFKTLAKQRNINTVLIVSGDRNQIQPLIAVETGNYSCIKESSDAHIEFGQQHRITDHDYESFLKTLLITPTPTLHIRNAFSNTDTRDVSYNYPVAIMTNMPDEPSDIYEWFETNDVVNALSCMFFSYTNIELQYNNISLALSIITQLKHYNGLDVKKYVEFHVLKYKAKLSYVAYPLAKDSEYNGRLPILPLVKGFPYKILTRAIESLPRSSIVYLLSWNRDHARVYHRETRSVYELSYMPFSMNLIKTHNLEGFPLQMYASETSYSAQGLTILKDIYANLSRASLSEAYVILSRVRTKSRCKVIHA